jgi:hypothetical protein
MMIVPAGRRSYRRRVTRARETPRGAVMLWHRAANEPTDEIVPALESGAIEVSSAKRAS